MLQEEMVAPLYLYAYKRMVASICGELYVLIGCFGSTAEYIDNWDELLCMYDFVTVGAKLFGLIFVAGKWSRKP